MRFTDKEMASNLNILPPGEGFTGGWNSIFLTLTLPCEVGETHKKISTT